MNTFQFRRGCRAVCAHSFLERRQRPAEAMQNDRYQEHDAENCDRRYEKDDQSVFQHTLTLL
jgi:hypothetical protein